MKCSCGKPACVTITDDDDDEVVAYFCIDCKLKYEQAQAIELHNTMVQLNAATRAFGMMSGIPIPQMPVPQLPPFLTSTMSNNVNVSNSTVGVINTGTIETIHSALSITTGPGGQEVARAVGMLTNWIADSDELPVEQRNELLLKLKTVAEEASKPAPRRRLDLVKSAFGEIAKFAQGANAIGAMWDRYSPSILAFFGI